MPVKIPNNLPAIALLKEENIFITSQLRAGQEPMTRPLRLVILNLMPIKITTERDLIRLLSNSPLQIDITLLRLNSHTSKNTSQEHINKFYDIFDNIQNDYYDGMIVTGAPVEMLEFEEVTYWSEVIQILDWARTHVTSTLYICWGAQAALWHFYGIHKEILPQKMFGVFKHTTSYKNHPLLRGFDDEFHIPHSRHTSIVSDEVLANHNLQILAQSDTAGIGIIGSRGGREFYLTGHSEYSPLALHEEYIRDKEKGMNVEIPSNYYKNDNPTNSPVACWLSHANLLFNNWLNYFVYQETPTNNQDIENLQDIERPENY